MHSPTSNRPAIIVVLPFSIQTRIGGTEGRRDRGTEGQRDRGTKGQRDKGTKGQRDKGTKGQQGEEIAKAAGKKRQFPYRKVGEIEAEVHDREYRLKEIHDELAFPETHRDGDRVRQLTAEAEEITQKLKHLYSHWEEAAELNW